MSTYSVRVRDGNTLLPDDGDRQEFATFDAVRNEAIESARQLLSDAVLHGKAASLNLSIEVTDEAGKIVLTVPVGRASGTESQV